MDISVIRELNSPISINSRRFETFDLIAEYMVRARADGASIIMMLGAHVIRSGVQKYIIDLMERGYISCLAMNGACIIHDFELAMIGATTESVSCYIAEGQFGLWKETGIINEIIHSAYDANHSVGMGEVIGKAIEEGDYPYKDTSLLAASYRQRIPATVHVGIGYDIIHELPNCDGAATGALSYNDFLRFVSVVQDVEGGIAMNMGSAVMAPEIFLKALSMARNVAHQKGHTITNFVTLVCDLHHLPKDVSQEPPKGNADYYYRPWKTMLVRTVSNGGKSYYVQGNHAETIPSLWKAINDLEK